MSDEVKTDQEVQPAEDEHGLDDLLSEAGLTPEPDKADSDGESDVQPQVDDKPEAPEETPPADTTEPAPADTQEPEETPDTDDSADDDVDDGPVTFKYKGKEYTLDDLKADETLRTKVFTSAEQQSHYQKLHDENRQRLEAQEKLIEELRRSDAQRQQQALAAQQAAAQPQLLPEQLTAAMTPVVDQMVKEGWVEEDLSSLYPNAVAGVMSMRDELFTRLEQVESAVGLVIDHTKQRTAAENTQSVRGRFNTVFDEISREGGIFSPLKSKETREEFLTHVKDTLNPEIGTLLEDPSVLRNLWIGLHHDKLLAQAEADHQAKLKELESQRVDKSRQMAAGEGGGPVPGAAAPTSPSEAELMAQQTWGDL